MAHFVAVYSRLYNRHEYYF